MMIYRTKTAARVFLGAIAAACLVPAGCNNEKAAPADEKKSKNALSETSQSQNLIRNAMTRLDPTRLGISSKPTSAAMGLNDWFKRHAADDWSADWPDPASLIGEESAGRAASQRFTEVDAEHIRTSLLLRAYAKSIVADDEVERIVRLFYAVIRDVAIRTGEPLALTPFEVILTGQGTPEDRAWLFASALRQLQIDSFRIAPSDAASDHWLLGVAASDRVLLFDPALGLPVFRPQDNADGPLPMNPAAFADLAAEDEVLGGMSVDGHPYPTVDSDFDSPGIQLIGEPTLWAQRSLLLQDSLSGDDFTIICDPLHDIDETPGMRSRVVAAGNGAWDAGDISLWSYPVQQLNGFAHMSEADQGRLAELMDPFKARVTREYTEEGIIFGAPAWELFKARVGQLQGEVGESISMRFQNIRLGRLGREITRDEIEATLRVPEEFYVIHLRAAEHATMWVAVHQYRGGEYAAAIDGLYGLRRQFAEGVWTNHADYLLALGFAQQADMPKAIARIAAAAEAGNAQDPGNRLLHARWLKAHPEAAGEAAGSDARPPAEAKSSTPEPAEKAAAEPVRPPEKKNSEADKSEEKRQPSRSA